MNNARSVSRPNGGIVVDGQQVADTVQCCHCGGHYVPVAGSGKVRGWCFSCMGPICGPGCCECVPFEKKLELYEKGKIARL